MHVHVGTYLLGAYLKYLDAERVLEREILTQGEKQSNSSMKGV